MKNYKLITALISLILLLMSCIQNQNEVGELESEIDNSQNIQVSIEPDTTVEGTLRLFFENRITNLPAIYYLQDENYFFKVNKEEILRTLEIVEKVFIEGTDLCVVFYRYSIGTQFKRGTRYFRQVNGRWTIHDGFYHYSEYYTTDPFNNGRGLEAKRLLEKIDEWEDNPDEVWW